VKKKNGGKNNSWDEKFILIYGGLPWDVGSFDIADLLGEIEGMD
jgi:hypothetical protein